MASSKGNGHNLSVTSRTITERLAPETRYLFRFGSPQYAITFQTRYTLDVSDNDFIFKLRLYGPGSPDPIDPAHTNWAFSKVANAMYAYSPAGEVGSVHALKSLESTSSFIRAEIEPVRWRGQGASPNASIGEMLATYKNRAHGAGLMTYRGVIVVSTKELIEE